jgi:type VI secretion system protein
MRQDEAPSAGHARERVLEHGRLVIGRGDESDWVLPDPGRTISKRHCVIEEAEFGYELTDLSTNGVFLNDEDEPVGVGKTRRLRHGDRIRIGPYRLAVELSGAQRSVSAEPTSLGLARGFDSLTELFHDSSSLRSGGDLFAEERPSMRVLSDLDRGPPTDEFFASYRAAPAEIGPVPAAKNDAPLSKAAVPGVCDIPENWAAALQDGAPPPPSVPPPPLLEMSRAPAPTLPNGGSGAYRQPPPHVVADTTGLGIPPAQHEQTPSSSMPVAPSSSMPAAPSDPVALFCAAAGLDPSLLAAGAPEEIMRKAGEIFRIAVEGLMAVLQSRRALKGEFRLESTEFRPDENNPLKFSVDAQAAMVMLIGKPRRGFLPAREAFEEAINDIRMHEVAILAGMQDTWLSLLQRFDPKGLSQRLEDDSGLANLLGSKKARCWDAFTTLYDSIAGNADDEWERTFRSIFGSAYERSMQKQRQRLG